jgi:hypothetical protein
MIAYECFMSRLPQTHVHVHQQLALENEEAARRSGLHM